MSDRESMIGKARELHPYTKIGARLVGVLALLAPGISSLIIHLTSDTEAKTEASYELLKEYVEMLQRDLDSTKSDIESLKDELRHQTLMRSLPWGYGMPVSGMPSVASEDPEKPPETSRTRPAPRTSVVDVYGDDDDKSSVEGAPEPPAEPGPEAPVLTPPEELFAPETVREKAKKRPSVKQLILPKNLDDALMLQRKK